MEAVVKKPVEIFLRRIRFSKVKPVILAEFKKS